jgi:hypothetical protein
MQSRLEILFTCPVCKNSYQTKKEAEQCRDQPVDFCGLATGSIVAIPSKASFGTDDNRWTAYKIEANPKAKSHFDRVHQYVPFAIITATHFHSVDKHRPVVTVLVPRKNGDIDYGWNPANGQGHFGMIHPAYKVQPSIDCRFKSKKEVASISKMAMSLKIPDDLLEFAKNIGHHESVHLL